MREPRFGALLSVLSLGALLVCLCAPALCLDRDRAISQYLQDVWQTEDGLPDNYVTSIVQTQDGYLWLGTRAGLVRFDGVRFTVFNRANTQELESNRVDALAEDSSGSLWIATPTGLVRYARRSFSRVTTAEGLPSNSIAGLAVDPSGGVWVATPAGAALVRDGKVTRLSRAEGLSSDDVRSVLRDRSGVLWVGTYDGGLNRVADGEVSVITTKDGLPGDDVWALAEGRDGALWVGCRNGIATLTNGTVAAVTTGPAAEPIRFVQAFCQDQGGAMWVATLNGMFRVRGGVAESFTVRDGLSNDVVRAVHEDREGNLWIGTEGGGLNRLKDGRLATVTTREGLSHDLVCPIYEGRDGTVWVGTFGGGLNRIRDGRITVLTTKDGLSSNNLNSLCEDRTGALWIGTVGGGLNRLENGRVTVFTRANGLPNDSVHSICEARDGTLWIGTDGGLAWLRDGQFGAITTAEGLPNNVVRHVIESRDGTLWVATGFGLAHVVGRECTVFGTEHGLPGAVLEGLYEDTDGTLWIGTERGLARMRDGRFSAITTEHGLTSDEIYSVLDDGAGNLWIGSPQGIFTATKAALNDVADGRAARVACTSFGMADGMRSEVCSHFFQPAGWRLGDGQLWFPTTKGVVVVDPAKLGASAMPPPVVLEQVLVDDVSLDLGADGARLEPGKQRIEFHYTGLNLAAPERVRFRYKLEGYDRDWVDAGTRREAFYTSLPAGAYTFRVAARTGDGDWNETVTGYRFELAPHPAETWWAYLLYAAGAVGLAYGGIRLRFRTLKRHNEELEARIAARTAELAENVTALTASEQRAHENELAAIDANRAKSAFLSNMSHELRTPLNIILGFVQIMARDRSLSAQQNEQLGIVTQAGEHLLTLIDDILSLGRIEAGRLTLNPVPFDLHVVLWGLEEMFRARAATEGLRFTFDVAPGMPASVVGDERKLRQILFNLLGNALKFTREGGITVRARWSDGRGIFEVEDTGPGIAEHEMAQLFEAFVQTESGQRISQGTGLGLAISRSFARLMDGDVTVSSTPGVGTVFRVEVALPESSEPAPAPTSERSRVVALEPGQEELRLLVVEDDARARTLLVQLLESIGLAVRQATNGEEAVAEWEAWHPHMIWMDMRMPVMDGYEATREIRRRETSAEYRVLSAESEALSPAQHSALSTQHSALPKPCVIIGLTASAFEHQQQAMREAGCDDFVPKPFREREIFDRIAERLGARFVYEGAEGAGVEPVDVEMAAQRLAAIPAAHVMRLEEAATLGNVRAANRAIETIRESDPALAHALDALIKQFAFDAVLDLIKAVARSR